VHLQVSAYDRVASLLIALLILVGAFVLLLFLIWLTARVLTMHKAVPVELIEELGGRQESAMGTARELSEPGVDELEDLVEPQLQDALAAVTDAISSQAAALDALDAPTSGRGRGAGDSRQPGPGGTGEDIIPRWQRWEIRFSSASLETYARQLDHFGIELAAIGGGKPVIDYARNLARAVPEHRTGAASAEDRLYMTWQGGELQQADRELLQRAKISLAGRLLVQFYPPNVEQQLATLEKLYAGTRDLKEIGKTIFGVRSAGAGYEFYVMEQQLRIGG